MKNKFNERIRELRIEKRLTQIKLSEILGVYQSTIAKWEKGELEPNMDMIIKISQEFNVSADYLIGLRDY